VSRPRRPGRRSSCTAEPPRSPGMSRPSCGSRRDAAVIIIRRIDFVGEEKRGGGITTERLRGAKSKVTKER
jgi:hypothetical protein